MLSYHFAPDAGNSGRAHWNHAMREVYGPRWFLDPLHPQDFQMSMQAVQLGDVTLSRAKLSEAEITTRAQQGGSKSARCYNIYTVDRTQRLLIGGRALTLEPGDFTLADSMLASTITTLEPYKTIGLTVPATLLRTYLPKPERAVGVRFSGSEGLSSIVSLMLRDMWRTVESCSPSVRSRVVVSLFEAFSACCDLAEPMASVATANANARRVQICEGIQQHLRESDFSVSLLGRKLGLSTRYIRMVFNDGGETISQYVRRERLEGCRRDLADPSWRNHSVSAIAFRWGFSSTAHFSRAFRASFGSSPMQFRSQLASRAR